MSDHIVNKPNIGKKDKIVKISGGVGHFIAMTESGKVYAWGDNTHGQCDISAENASDCFAGAYQSYVFDKDGKLVAYCTVDASHSKDDHNWITAIEVTYK